MAQFMGTVVNGVVVFDGGGGTPPEGTKENVTLHAKADAEPTETAADTPTLIDLLQFAGKAEGMPADLAEHHDHYVHETPKR